MPAEFFNAILFMASAPFIYAVARQAIATRYALILTFVVLISPISSYTAYFMPESLYFTIFWAFAWFMVGRGSAMTARTMVLAGVGIGVLALVKIHGVFLLPGLLLFIIAETGGDWRIRLRRTAVLYGAVLLGFFAVRWGVGFLFAGSAGLHPLGSAYSELAHEAEASISPFSFLGAMFRNLAGHLAGLGLIVGIPMIMAAICIFRPGVFIDKAGHGRLSRVAAFAFAFMTPLLLVSAAFAAMIAERYPEDASLEIVRIQWRFYNFIFPMFFIVAAGTVSRLMPDAPLRGRGRWLFAIPLAMAAYAALTRFHGFLPSTIPDCPELGSLYTFPSVFLCFLVVYAAICVDCMVRPFRALRAYLLFVVPFFFLVGSGVAQYEAINGFGALPDIYDKAGIFAKEYLGDECDTLTVVDAFINSGKKALIHIDNPDTDLLPQFDSRVDMSAIRPGGSWLLLIGDFSVPDGVDKFSISYTDPAQTEELTAYMRQHGNTRVMLRYVLMRIVDFDFSVDLSVRDQRWPVAGIEANGNAAVICYTLPLSGRYGVAVENGAHAGVFHIEALNDQGIRIASASFSGAAPAILEIPRPQKSSRLIVTQPTSSASLPVRLKIESMDAPRRK